MASMGNLFGVDFRGLFGAALGPLLLPLVLKKRTPGTYNASDPSAGPIYSEVSYPCKGIVSITEAYDDDEGIVRMKTGEGTIMLGTLPTGVRIQSGDVITFTAPGGTVAQDGFVTVAPYDPAGAQVSFRINA